ncbi:hypothetical protein H671_2g4897 [Cricetulus griseus]|nr:hypothetical protein H671_2g4897 [Cricetulus griseus]
MEAPRSAPRERESARTTAESPPQLTQKRSIIERQNGNAPLGFGEFAFEAVGFFMESRNMDGCKKMRLQHKAKGL